MHNMWKDPIFYWTMFGLLVWEATLALLVIKPPKALRRLVYPTPVSGSQLQETTCTSRVVKNYTNKLQSWRKERGL